MDEPKNQISQDDLATLRFFLGEYESTPQAQAVRRYQAYLAKKYQIQNGDQIDVTGTGAILRAIPTQEPAQ